MICLHQNKQKVVINSFYYPISSIHCVLPILGKIWIIFHCIFTHQKYSPKFTSIIIIPLNVYIHEALIKKIKSLGQTFNFSDHQNIPFLLSLSCTIGKDSLKTFALNFGLGPIYSLKRDLRNVNCNLWHYRSSFMGLSEAEKSNPYWRSKFLN